MKFIADACDGGWTFRSRRAAALARQHARRKGSDQVAGHLGAGHGAQLGPLLAAALGGQGAARVEGAA